MYSFARAFYCFARADKFCFNFTIFFTTKVLNNETRTGKTTVHISPIMAQSHSPANEVPMSQRCDFHRTRPNTGRTFVACVAQNRIGGNSVKF